MIKTRNRRFVFTDAKLKPSVSHIFQHAGINFSLGSSRKRTSFRSRRFCVASVEKRKGETPSPLFSEKKKEKICHRRGKVVIFGPRSTLEPRQFVPTAVAPRESIYARNRHTSCTLDAVTINLERVRSIVSAEDAAAALICSGAVDGFAPATSRKLKVGDVTSGPEPPSLPSEISH